MRSKANKDKLHALANFLLNRRGYLVIGDVYGGHSEGDVSHVLWNVEQDQPIHLICRTDASDWHEQLAVAKQEFSLEFQRTFYEYRDNVQPNSTTVYWRAITD